MIVGLSRPTLLQYLEFLEKTYLIRRVPAYTANCATTVSWLT